MGRGPQPPHSAPGPRAMRLPLVLLALGCVVRQVPALQPRITRVAPDRGYRSGGFRIRLDGENLVFLPNQAQVMVGILPCTDVRVEAPWAAISCLAPACPGCNVENVIVNIGGQLTNTLPLRYTGICEGPQLLENKPRVKLPAMYSGAENCTICRLLISGALSAVPDRVSYESLRIAMRDICGSPLVREFKMLDPACKHNMRDYFVPVSKASRVQGPGLRCRALL